MLADILKQVHDLVFRLEQSFSEVILISNVLDWVVLESFYILFSDKHNRNDDFKHQLVNKKFQFLHRRRFLSAITQKLQRKTQALVAYKLRFFRQYDLQVAFQQRNLILQYEIVRKRFDMCFIFANAWVSVLYVKSVSQFAN